MRKLLLLVLITATLLPAQAVWNNFSQTVKGVTIGQVHCYFFSLSGQQYDSEVACYTNNVLQSIFAKIPGSKLVGSYPTATGIITWILTPGLNVHYQVTGKGTDNVELRQTGDF